MVDSSDSGADRAGEFSAGSGEPAPEFVSLFLAHQWRLHRYIATLLASQQDVEDLVQETAAILWRRFSEFEPGTNFFAWACKTAYHLVLKHRQRQTRDAMPLDQEVLEQLAIFAAQRDLASELRLSALDQCLRKLPPQDRELIERCYSVDSKVKDVAAQLDRSAKSVRKSLGRIRRMLMECLRRTLAVAEREGGNS
jgi:RNA polymerase sigma-70 factor (ECF subfamily)